MIVSCEIFAALTERVNMDSETVKQLEEVNRKQQAREAFSLSDRTQFSNLPDDSLALIHSQFHPGDPQHIMCEHEWNIRLMNKQLKSIRFATWAGIVATLGGVIVGCLLTHLLK
jgi:hypothetical protein